MPDRTRPWTVTWTQHELLEQMPFNVAVIDRDYNVVEANSAFEESFGSWKGHKCFEVYKGLRKPCPNCEIMATFTDGVVRVTDEVGTDQHGHTAHYVVHSSPLHTKPGGSVDYVLEMSRNVVDTDRWQREYQILFDRVPCYIAIIDRDFRIIRSNAAFRDQFGDDAGRHCYEVYKKRKRKCPHCPAAKSFKDGATHKSNQVGINKSGERTHYVVTTAPLTRRGQRPEHIIEISTDVTELKKLEDEKIEAERLAAVGQTVAGLAHSVKNILMGLEGGKYIVGLGLQKEDKAMISQGWDILERNFDKTTSLVKDFLSFAKGRLPRVRMVDPNGLVTEIVDLYREVARRSHIDLRAEITPGVKPVPLDPDGLHTCLTNLVSNSLDACQMSEQRNCEVMVRCKSEKGNVIFEVQDNGLGMDYELKSKIFTTFFTTKGGEGTGLGLLTTRKIVQEHGGKITIRTKKGEGSRFRITLPRKRLMALLNMAKEAA